MKTLLLSLVALLLVGVGCALFFSDTSPEKARALVANGARLVDVRTPEEFAAGHLEGAINIPVGEVPARLAEFGPKGEPIVVYCRSGARSSRAQKALKEAGYTQVHNLGAMSRW